MSDKIKRSSNIQNEDHARTRPVLDLNRTAARKLFINKSRPWDALPCIAEFIRENGCELPYDEFDEINEDVWVHVSAYLSPTAKIEAPAIICGGAKINHFSTVASSVIGAFAQVGECSRVNGSILFDRSKLCGMNYFSHSILGYGSVVGQGAQAPDTRLDGLNVSVDMPEGIYVTGRTHLGSIICDGVAIGSNCVINPGTVIDTGSKVHPLTSVSAYIYPYTTVK